MRRTFLAIALPALTLAGCDHYRGIEPEHQPVVSQATYGLDVATVGDHLAPGEAERLSGWMAALQLGYGDEVSVDAGSGDPAGVSRDVSVELARYGLLLSPPAPVPGAPIAPRTARVLVSRSKAQVPGCPDFALEYVPNFDAHTTGNFGCATNSNLAAMIANPQDLVRGDPRTRAFDAATSGKAIKSYRDAAPTGKDGLPGGVSSVSVVKTGG